MKFIQNAPDPSVRLDQHRPALHSTLASLVCVCVCSYKEHIMINLFLFCNISVFGCVEKVSCRTHYRLPVTRYNKSRKLRPCSVIYWLKTELPINGNDSGSTLTWFKLLFSPFNCIFQVFRAIIPNGCSVSLLITFYFLLYLSV